MGIRLSGGVGPVRVSVGGGRRRRRPGNMPGGGWNPALVVLGVLAVVGTICGAVELLAWLVG